MEHLEIMREWLTNTTNARLHRHNSLHIFRWHLILSLIFQHVRIYSIMTPKEARDRILIRLQQEYYPLRQTPTLFYLGIKALVLVRYFWLAAKMLFLELYLLDLAFWKIHRYARRRNVLPQYTRIFSPGFHRLAVLAPLPPSRFRYLMARIVAGIWYWWASFLSIPLIAWIVFTAAKL
ncbi:hypothetical protein GGI35DRAFT_459114 [Trichoderma velutinum]